MVDKAPRNSILEAATKAGVPFAEFKLWLLDNVRVNHYRWSKWNSGAEPIPEKYVIQFLRERLTALQKEPPSGQVSGPPTNAPGETVTEGPPPTARRSRRR